MSACEICGNPDPFISSVDGCCLSCGDGMQLEMKQGGKVLQGIVQTLRELKTAKAEVARLTAACAAMRLALDHWRSGHFPVGVPVEPDDWPEPNLLPCVQGCPGCYGEKLREAALADDAGAGLMRRLAAAEAVCEAVGGKPTHLEMMQLMTAWRKTCGE